MKDKHFLSIVAVEHPAGRLDDLAIAGTLEFLRPTATFRVIRQLLHMRKDTLNELCGRSAILQGYVVADCIKIAQGRL